MSILHIHNGDVAADVLRQTGLPGSILAWREALTEGPTPTGLDDPGWLRKRAAFLAEAYDMPYYEVLDTLSSQHWVLQDADQYEEVVLWFEHDLVCQITLAYLLHWFTEHPLQKAKLSLVCIDHFDEVAHFHGLGDLSPSQMAFLFPQRVPVRPEQLATGQRVWDAYTAESPEDLTRLLQVEDLEELPFMKAALYLHAARFPSSTNGLGRIEQRILDHLQARPLSFGELFKAFQESDPEYGLGDLQLASRIEAISFGQHRLVMQEGPIRQEGLIQPTVTMQLTETGHEVLDGEKDFITLRPLDTWLGGVHLESPNRIWRYQPETLSFYID